MSLIRENELANPRKRIKSFTLSGSVYGESTQAMVVTSVCMICVCLKHGKIITATNMVSVYDVQYAESVTSAIHNECIINMYTTTTSSYQIDPSSF